MPLPPFQRRYRKRTRRLGPKDQVLRDWRGLDVGSLKLEQRRAETEIVKVWNQTIDPAVSEHAQPSGIRKGTLFVSVDSSVWLDEIVRYRRHEILKRLQFAMGREMIQKISFRIG